MKGLSQDQAAELIGVTTRRLRQLENEDSPPPRSADGTYPAADFGRWLRQRLLAELGVANDGKAYDYNAERARLTKAQADKTELEVAELRGDLVRASEVGPWWEALAGNCRARILAIPAKVAPMIAPPDGVTRVQDILQAECYEALAEIANDGLPSDVRARREAHARAKDANGVASAAAPDGEPVGGRKATAQRRKQRGAGAVED